MSDEELRKLAERLRDYNLDGTGSVRVDVDCDAAASAILSLMEDRNRLTEERDRLTDPRQIVGGGFVQLTDYDAMEARATIAEARLGRAVEALREIDGLLTNMQPKLVTDGEWIDFASFRLVQASAAILSLMSERDEANARALNWECRFEAASARGAAAEARIRELSLSELTALGQADENHKRALDAEARLEKAKEALREIDGHLTNMQPKLVNGPLALDKDRLAMVDRYVGPAIDAVRSVLTSLESRDEAN